MTPGRRSLNETSSARCAGCRNWVDAEWRTEGAKMNEVRLERAASEPINGETAPMWAADRRSLGGRSRFRNDIEITWRKE